MKETPRTARVGKSYVVIAAAAVLGLATVLGLNPMRLDRSSSLCLSFAPQRQLNTTTTANATTATTTATATATTTATTTVDGSENTFRITPTRGAGFFIYQPKFELTEVGNYSAQVLPPSESFITAMKDRMTWVSPILTNAEQAIDANDNARDAYLNVLLALLSGIVFHDAERSIKLWKQKKTFEIVTMDEKKRLVGEDWPYLGDTMTGNKRLQNIQQLWEDVIKNGVPGDQIETGVWRGGSSIFARAVMNVNGEGSRITYVCDSFQGLPPSDGSLHPHDIGWDSMKYLEIPSTIVAQNFKKFNLLDDRVVFVEGFFKDTMPPLSKLIDKLAVIRLDGDMYESTVDVLYHLYDKLSVGGYVIVDDWIIPSAQAAVHDFFRVHDEAEPTYIEIDRIATYWQKTKDFPVQYWRYTKKKFKKGS